MLSHILSTYTKMLKVIQFEIRKSIIRNFLKQLQLNEKQEQK